MRFVRFPLPKKELKTIVNSEPIYTMNQMMPNRMPNNYNNYNRCQSPATSKLTLEQQYVDTMNRMLPQQAAVSNPYNDYLETFNSFPTLMQRKIQEDPRYIEAYSQCQSALLHEAFSQVLPTVLSTQSGRALFETLNTTTRLLGDECMQAELNREKEMAEREKAADEERKQLELQKQELAAMLAQIKELQLATPTVTSQNARVQQYPVQGIPSMHTAQNPTEAVVEPVDAVGDGGNNQRNNNGQYRNNQGGKNKFNGGRSS